MDEGERDRWRPMGTEPCTDVAQERVGLRMGSLGRRPVGDPLGEVLLAVAGVDERRRQARGVDRVDVGCDLREPYRLGAEVVRVAEVAEQRGARNEVHEDRR